MRGLVRASLAVALALALSGARAPAAGAAGDGGESIAQRRLSRLIAHLNRLQRPGDWRLVRKLFSADRSVQLSALANCPLPENEWPWYLSSPHLEEYAFTADFLPVNMDADPEPETLMVIRSDPNPVSYITFCLMDDDKRGRAPLASYSDISHGRPITYQVVDLTGDGASELVVYVREARSDGGADAVRVIKSNPSRSFELVWFARLREEFEWPLERPGPERTLTRKERLVSEVRFLFDGPRSPATLVLKGEREETVTRFNGARRVSTTTVHKLPFREQWRWDKERFQFVRVSSAP